MGWGHSQRRDSVSARSHARRPVTAAAIVAVGVVATARLGRAEIVATPTPLPQRPLAASLHGLRRVDGILALAVDRAVGQARFTVPRTTFREEVPPSSATPAPGAPAGMDVRVELTVPLEAPVDAAGSPVPVDLERRLQVVAGNCGAALRGARGGLEELGDFTSPADGRAGLQAHSNLGYAQLRGRSLLVVRPEGGGFPDEVLLACGEIGPE